MGCGVWGVGPYGVWDMGCDEGVGCGGVHRCVGLWGYGVMGLWGYGLGGVGYGMRDVGPYGVWDIECGVRDMECRIWGCEMWGVGYGL